jgi:endonuclease YncB( thermonuclease family)
MKRSGSPRHWSAVHLLIGFCLLQGGSPTTLAAGKAEAKWVEQKDAKLSDARQADGDSFGMEIKNAKGNPLLRTFRLYGVDCPESNDKDKVLDQRRGEQAAWFDCDPKQISALGKEAANFTEKLLKHGKPKILTRGKIGKKAEKSPGRPQRYYALVEVTAGDGKRRWLHELLLENGLARAYGVPAAWPPEEEDRHGVKEAEEEFGKHLDRLEKTANRQGLGVWKKK